MSSDVPKRQSPPHIALLPSAGMGHFAPFCRLAAALSSRGCDVTFITTQPTISSAESLRTSDLLSSFPSIRSLNLPLVPLDPSLFPPNSDPFYLRYEAIRRSSHLLRPLLLSSSTDPPFSALIVDIGLSSSFLPLANSLSLPSFILFTTSAAFLSFYAHFPTHIKSHPKHPAPIGDVDVPGLWTVPSSSVVPFLHVRDHFLTTQFIENSLAFPRADGILINTFEAMEPDALAALNAGRVNPDLPTVFAIGPLRSHSAAVSGARPPHAVWLDEQPDGSVLYVSFGSRTAMSPAQIRELAAGLESSGCRFLWVIKTKVVDRDEATTELGEVIGEGFVERVKKRGLVVNGWVEQDETLRHRAVGGFLSHCGWNSVTEAAMAGVRVMAWPRGVDQRVNGAVVRRRGLGVWMEEWRWEAEDGVVGGEEIGRSVKEFMEDEGLRVSAERLGEKARVAVDSGGSSDRAFDELIYKLQES